MENLTWDNVISSDVSLTFVADKTQMKNFLNEIGNDLNEEGFVIDKKTGKKVISQDEGEVKLNELGSISSGSKAFIKRNIASYAEFLSKKRNS